MARVYVKPRSILQPMLSNTQSNQGATNGEDQGDHYIDVNRRPEFKVLTSCLSGRMRRTVSILQPGRKTANHNLSHSSIQAGNEVGV